MIGKLRVIEDVQGTVRETVVPTNGAKVYWPSFFGNNDHPMRRQRSDAIKAECITPLASIACT